MKRADLQRYFFSRGVCFECTQCGQCCTGAPGHVWVNDEEVDRLAALLGLARGVFLRRYTRLVGRRRSLKERPDGSCVFFKDRCTVYEARPGQCRTYPFWFENLRSRAAWEQTKEECPGIGRGRRFTKEEILDCIHEDMRESRISNIEIRNNSE